MTDPAGRLLSASWDGTQEVLNLIDPTTGTIAVIGVIDDLEFWWGQTMLSGDGGTLDAIGEVMSAGRPIPDSFTTNTTRLEHHVQQSSKPTDPARYSCFGSRRPQVRISPP